MSGCGRGAYESRLEGNLGYLRAAALFSDVHDAATTLPGTPVTVRLPKFVNNEAKAYAEQAGDGGDPLRVQPPFMKLPGLRVTYEIPNGDPATGQRVLDYCYLGAVPAGEAAVGGKPLEAFVAESLTAAFPNSPTPPAWSDVSCPNPNGVARTWQMIGASGGQTFPFPSGAPGEAPGAFRLYTAEIEGWRVIIGWRFHDGTFNERKVEDIAKVVAGTVTVPAADGAAPTAQ